MNNSITNLLDQVYLIKKKYDDLAEYTGENFNIFGILGVYSSELSHSAFIGNLLNVKGKHGQKDIFLNIFIEEIKGLFEDKTKLESLEMSQSYSIVEKYLGRVDNKNEKGGYIDIFITDGKNGVGIENKIWAGDQHKQLVRYYEENIPIVYLTLDGKEPDASSKQHLENGIHFICVSYEHHIINWLEKCIKEMVNKPIIRETLNQYLYLVKQLTNQTSNHQMAEEVINSIKKNLEASKLVFENYNKAIEQIKLFQVEKLKDIIECKGLVCNIERGIRKDGFFTHLKAFEIDGEMYDLGIQIELNNDYYFFCVIQQGKNRNPNINNDPKFSHIKDFLKKRISLTQFNGWTIAKANDFTIGIDRNNYFLPNTNNEDAFERLANRLLEFKELLKDSPET